MSFLSWLSLAVIILTLVGVALGQFPRLWMNRATIALVGATLLVALSALTLDQAYKALDLNTLTLLLAMMVINVNLRLSGFFQLVSARVSQWASSPKILLALIIVTSGVLSALFLNDTVVLMYTPLVLEIAMSLDRDPIPYLIGLVTAANIGSTATITGNPQNMLVGLASKIPFVTFSAYLAPIAIVSLFVAWAIVVLIYPKEFKSGPFAKHPQVPVQPFKPLLYKSLIAVGLMLVAFVLGVPIPLAAMAAAAWLLITRRIKPDRIFRGIDWSLLIFFAGLFVVTGAIETLGFSQQLFAVAAPIAEAGVLPLTLVSVVLSNLVSNVPAVLLFRSLIPSFPNPQQAWLTLAMATTLAGNLTLLGSVANLIVAETAKAHGVNLSFKEYLKAGVPITLVTLTIGVLWLSIVKP
jgi:Na+/H+ antiporter NhaD/arsenite permease-like protein